MNGRTKFVVGSMAVLYVISWLASLGRLIFGEHFYDREYALSKIMDSTTTGDDDTASSSPSFPPPALNEIAESYYGPRYIYFAPHVFGAIFWWNLYFLQLIPSVRHAYNKKIHRVLGRFLMVCCILQVMSGVGLALTSHSKIILLISLILCVASTYCIYQAWFYAIHRDIPKHKYWVMRLVGYMQTIALQRFWLIVLVASHEMGFYGLYPNLAGQSVEVANEVVLDMFDHSFILCILTAVFVTEWYLAGEQGMMEPPVRTTGKVINGSSSNNESSSRDITNDFATEKQPLL